MYDMIYHADEALRCTFGRRDQDHRWIAGYTPQYACVLLCQGRAEVRYDDQTGIHPMLPGDCLQRFPQRAHAIRFTEDSATWSLALPATCLQALADCGQVLPSEVVFRAGLDQTMLEGFSNLSHDLQNCPTQDRPSLLPAFIEHLRLILAAHEPAATNLWNEACRLLEQNITMSCDLQRLAKALDMPYTSFRIGFKRHFGQAPGQWRIRRKLEQARSLLSQGLSVAACADALGYCDAFAFSRQFKQQLGLSPSQWRAQAW